MSISCFEIFAQKKDGKFEFSKQEWEYYFSQLRNGNYKLTVKSTRKNLNRAKLFRFYHGVVLPEISDASGSTAQFWDRYYKILFLLGRTPEELVGPDEDLGSSQKFYNLSRVVSLRELDTIELIDFFEKIFRDAFERFEVILSFPNPKDTYLQK